MTQLTGQDIWLACLLFATHRGVSKVVDYHMGCSRFSIASGFLTLA